MMEGIVSHIQHFSVGDGPGIRTTVFLKGCNLRCRWCHNPETFSPEPQLLYYKHLCTSCGKCAAVCPARAHTMEAGVHSFKRELCSACGQCVKYCIHSALSLCGQRMSVDEVVQRIMQDGLFYTVSGGGVTLSGGEPLLQPEFCAQIASECKKIPVFIETAGNVSYAAFETVIPYMTRFYYDIKGASEEDYRELTKGSLVLVLENLTRLVSEGADVTVRIPIIPDYNDSVTYCCRLAEILQPTGVKAVNLLPFHPLGSGKYRAMGIEYPYKDILPPTAEKINELYNFFMKRGINCEKSESRRYDRRE